MNEATNKKPIGVFDSGIGGLTVVREIRKLLPKEDIVYLGDSARVPYGNKSVETIRKFGFQDANFLVKMGVKLIVVACNTVSSVALGYLKETFKDVPFFGVVEPGVKVAIKETRSRRVGVIGTIATVKSEAHKKIFPEGYEVIGKACPLFVPLAEEGMTSGPIAKSIAEHYLFELKDKVDTVILGCTHYPVLKATIKEVLGDKIVLVDPAEEVAKEVYNYLQANRLLNSEGGSLDLYLTDIPPHYESLISLFLGERANNIRKVDIENL
ncbi:MAG: glutamate racemase [bacterium]|nr:glutamate racemase [bacterium]